MAPRRIALFTANYVSIVDGVALTLNRLVSHLRDSGHEVAVFAPDHGRRALEPGGEFHGLPSVPAPVQPEYRLAVALPRAARARLAALRPDIIHVATPDWVGLLAQRYGRARGIPVVASFHSNIVAYLAYVRVLRHFQPIGWRYFRYFYRRCRHVYVPTESMADELRARGIFRGLRLWERGVDHRRFSAAHRSEAFRAAHGIARDDVVVLFVGRLRWEKGLNLMAEVFLRLERAGMRCRTMIVGDGVGLAPLRRRLPNTIFTGRLEAGDLAAAYASADLFFFPSAVETFGNVILEAMASGLPCVCADAPGSRSVARDGETALLARRDDCDDFFAKTSTLLQDAAMRRRMAARAIERAGAYSWSAANDRLIAHYEAAIVGEG